MYFAACNGAQNAELGQPAWKHRLNCLAKPAWLGTLLPAAALALTLLWTHSPTQSGTPSDVLASYWGIQMVPPWEGFRLFLERLFFTPRVFIDWIDLSLFLFMLAACIVGLFRLDPAFSLYSWLYIGLLMMRGTPPHLLDSFSRYFLALFPAFLLLGRIGHRWGLIILWIVSFALQIILSWGFLQWKWVA
jgi:hypothetical protein